MMFLNGGLARLCSALLPALLAGPAAAGWITLFDGAEGTTEAARGVAVGTLLEREDGGYAAFAAPGGAASDRPGKASFARLMLDRTGRIEGQIAWIGPENGGLRAAAAAPDGGHVLAGRFRRPATRPILSETGIAEAWVARLDPAGAITWARRFDDLVENGADRDRHYALRDVAATPDGGLVAIGETHRVLARDAATGVPDHDLWVVRLGPEGHLLWQRRYGGDQIDGGLSIHPHQDGSITATGLTSGRGALATSGELLLLRLGPGGDVRWQKSYGGPTGPATGFDAGWGLAALQDGGYAVAGATRSFGRGGGAQADVWVMSLGPRGDVRWQYAYGGEGLETAPTMLAMQEGLVIAAMSRKADTGRWDAWLAHLGHGGDIRWQARLARPGQRVFARTLAPAAEGFVTGGVSVSAEGGAPAGQGFVARIDPGRTPDATPPDGPFRLLPGEARRRETPVSPRETALSGAPAQARMTPLRFERREVRIVATHSGNGAGADGTGTSAVPSPGPVAESYVAHIGPQDLTNSEGARLREPWQVLQQDRANYHRFGQRDPRDEGDSYFDTREARDRIPAMFEAGGSRGAISAAVVEGLREGGVTLRVRVHDSGDPRARYLDIALLGEDANAGAPLPRVARLRCGADACLSKGPGEAAAPPHDRCWGWYNAHIYSLLGLSGAPPDVTAVAGIVTGGPSERDEMLSGFRLDAISADCLGGEVLSALRSGGGCIALGESRCWAPLARFAAPAASGAQALVHWRGDQPGLAALRLRAPEGGYVDNSALWVEHAGGRETGNMPERLFTEADDGREVRLSAGETFRVRLPANRTTGFSWAVTRNDPSVLEVTDRAYRQDPGCDGKLGCGGHTTLTSEATGAGEVALQLGYGRQWKDGESPGKTFGLSVTVTGG